MIQQIIEKQFSVVRRLTNQKLSASEIEQNYDRWLPAVAPKVFSHPFEWFHRLFFDWYWPLLKMRVAGIEVPEEMPRAALLCLGRGLGKSAMLEGVSLAEGAHFGRSFGLYVSSTQKKCEEHLQTARGLIESSEVARYYPGLAEPLVGKFGNQRGWRAEALYTKSGFTLIAASLEQGVRGLRDMELRPTFIMLDDIDERDDSPRTKEEKFETITKDILPMLAPFGLAFFAQNKIYDGSIMDDTLKRKLDWYHLRHEVGVVNTFQDDLEIKKIDARPIIVAGTPNWDRINRQVAQDMLNKAGEDAFWRECQNITAPRADQLVWTGFSERLHVISWDQFRAVIGSDRIPSDFDLHAGYDAGATGPEKHPAVFGVAAVAPESSPLRDNVFLFYEFVADAAQDEHDMARALVADLAQLCAHYAIGLAAKILADSYQPDLPEQTAWELRRRAGAMIPFKSFRGSHEAKSERRTFNNKWGLSVTAGDSSKTAGLSQLRFYLKPEDRKHPFKPHVIGQPTIYLVAASDQLSVARNRFGMQRTRWEAANLKWDVNITARDVPTKFGDDATDCVKHVLSQFKVGAPLTDRQRLESLLPRSLQQQNLPDPSNTWEYEGAMLARDIAVGEAKKKINKGRESLDDPWNPNVSPLENVPDSPWSEWER